MSINDWQWHLSLIRVFCVSYFYSQFKESTALNFEHSPSAVSQKLLWHAFLPSPLYKNPHYLPYGQVDLFMGLLQNFLPRSLGKTGHIFLSTLTTWRHCSFIILLLRQPELCSVIGRQWNTDPLLTGLPPPYWFIHGCSSLEYLRWHLKVKMPCKPIIVSLQLTGLSSLSWRKVTLM